MGFPFEKSSRTFIGWPQEVVFDGWKTDIIGRQQEKIRDDN